MCIDNEFPLMSVLIPAYNEELCVLKTLESVLMQTYKNIEVVIIDDGSTDSTAKIINNFLKSNNLDWKVISQKNGGLAVARNVALQNMTGDYFCNLDAGDYFEHDIIEKVVKCIYEHQDIDVCYFGYNGVNAKYEFMRSFLNIDLMRTNKSEDGVLFAIKKLNGYFSSICQGNTFYSSRLIKTNQLSNVPGINQGEDLYFIILCLMHAKNVIALPYMGTNILYVETSMSNSNFNESFLQVFKAVENLEVELKKMMKIKDSNENLHILLDYVKKEYVIQYLSVLKKLYSSYSVLHYSCVKKLTNKYKELGKLDKTYIKSKNLLSKSHKLQLFLSQYFRFAYFIVTNIYKTNNKN